MNFLSQLHIRINLNPGEFYIAEEPAVVWTILGSCVAIVLYSPRLRIGAMSHAQLASEHTRDHMCSDYCPHPCYMAAPDSSRFKYVSCSFRYLVECFTQLGVAHKEITVKLFGGANMFPIQPTMKSVGEENIEMAYHMIQEYRLELVSEHVGGTAGRTLYFNTESGDVWLKVNKPGLFIPAPQPTQPLAAIA